MKYFITLIIIVIPFFLFSQNNTEKKYEIHKEKVNELKSYSDIMPDFPVNIKWITIKVSGNVGGHPMSSTLNEKDFGLLKGRLEKTKLNDILYIDIKYRAQDDRVLSESYKIKIVK